MLTNELRQSEAYQSLPPLARVIVSDIIRLASKVASGYGKPLPDGFHYTYKHCGERCSENAFYQSIGLILAHGILETPAHLQPDQALKPIVYIPSRKWQTWADSEATERLRKCEASKARKVKRNSDRRVAFLAGYAQPKQKQPTKNGGKALPKNEGILRR